MMDICKEAIHFTKILVRTKTAGDRQKDPYMIDGVYPIFDDVEEESKRHEQG
jgi:hypothetical protein